ncbi:MAG: T9SS type A sorting domain-containing protein [Bacteroidales bacterium]|nr:T9SS type A sorting domain-containing protein [Bacteroidales bacterium]
MKKLLLSIVLLAGAVLAYAQADTVPNLLITEWRGESWNNSYVEITNIGDTAIDMADVFYSSIPPGRQLYAAPYGYSMDPAVDDVHGTYLSGILGPGESMVIASMYDAPDAAGATKNLQRFLDSKHFFSYKLEASDYYFPYHPEVEMWGKDSVSNVAAGADNNFEQLLRLWGSYASAIWYKYPTGDSVMVDQVRFAVDATLHVDSDPEKDNVAGVEDATSTHTLVRKANTPRGNLDWDDSRGIDIADSEWLPIPFYGGKTLYTTVGNHGDYSIVLEPESTIEVIDTTALTVNWGIYKGDSIMDEFTIGDGMGWQYIEDTIDFADSAHAIVQTGDILNVFACGNDLEWHSYKITVATPATDMALVFPKRRMRFEAMQEEDFNGIMWGAEPYYVTEDQPEMDTIGDVPFATRVDTLYKYLEKASNASWEIVWVDDNERVDVKYGDILKVTAEDGTTIEEYFIDVQEFEASDNARLGAITWPEKPEGIFDWKGDTIPGFNPSSQSYILKLDYGTKLVPALLASPEDMNATISVNRATSLTGGTEQRTTTFIVTAEDDSTVLEYKVLFVIDRPLELDQPYVGEPFISEMVAREQAWGAMLEIMNPQGIPLDISEYMIVTTGTGLDNPADAVADIRPVSYDATSFDIRYQKAYVPGYKFAGDTSEWKVDGMRLKSDQAVDPFVEPMDVFVVSQAHQKPEKVSPYINEADVIVSPIEYSPWPNESHHIRNLLNNLSFDGDNYVFLFKITSDSVFNGLKEVGDIGDLELVDRFGPTIEGYNIAGRILDNSKATRLMLKPNIFYPTIELGAGFGTTEENSDWIMNHSFDPGWNEFRMSENIGSHAMDLPTVHKSTVASLVYLVDDGFTGNLMIQGDFTGLAVSGFMDNIIKADTGQVLTIMNGVEKAAGDDIAGGDTLQVVSADGNNTTLYRLLNQPLDDDALLVVKPAYTGSYTVTVDGANGTISGSGIQWGKPIKDILSALEVPVLATFNIIDQDDRQVPLKIINYDLQTVDVRLSDSIFFEVIAQNGTTIIYYQLKPESMSSEAFVVSSMFLVDQDNVNISLIPEGIGVEVFMEWIDPVTGATAAVIDKYSNVRISGTLAYDDKLEVVSEDGTNRVVYYLNFLNEASPDNNLAPTLSVAFADTNIIVNQTITLKATADDDDMPLPTLLTVTWKVISGEGVTIADPGALETDVTFAQAGAVVLQVTVDDGEISRTEIINVGVSTPGNSAPTVSVTTANFTIEEGESINVGATADDDGNPIGSTLTYEWTVKTGVNANVTITSANQLDTEVTFSTAGVYTLQITVTDGELIATDIVVVVVEEAVGFAPVLEPGLSLYPNPVSGILTLELQNMGDISSTVKLFNITGQAVYNGEFTMSKLQIDVSNFDAGLYFVTVHAADQTFTERIQIVK